MREHPWHVRRLTQQHEVWFNHLTEIHSLTTEWLKELEVSQERSQSHSLPRGVTQNLGVSESLWMLESFAREARKPEGRGLASLMDDTYPEDVLGRLERTVWIVQALTLSHLLSQVKEQDRAVLLNHLEQVSWKLGRNYAQAKWAGIRPELTQDARGVFAAFQAGPFSGYPNTSTFLVRRALPHQVQALLLASPYQSPYTEVRNVAPELQWLHVHWARGFAYALSPKIAVGYTPPATEQARPELEWHVNP